MRLKGGHDPAGKGTMVELVYAVGGYSPGGLQAIAPVVDKVLADQLGRLKAYVEGDER